MNYICSMNNWVELERQLPFQKPPTLPVNCDLPFLLKNFNIFHLIWLIEPICTSSVFILPGSRYCESLLISVVKWNVGHCLQVKDGTAVKRVSHLLTSSHSLQRCRCHQEEVCGLGSKGLTRFLCAAFPLAFLIFNIFYWITYKIISHEDVHKK